MIKAQQPVTEIPDRRFLKTFWWANHVIGIIITCGDFHLIVALGAAHVDAEEHDARLVGQLVEVADAMLEESAGLLVFGQQQLADNLVIGGRGAELPADPFLE